MSYLTFLDRLLLFNLIMVCFVGVQKPRAPSPEPLVSPRLKACQPLELSHRDRAVQCLRCVLHIYAQTRPSAILVRAGLTQCLIHGMRGAHTTLCDLGGSEATH